MFELGIEAHGHNLGRRASEHTDERPMIDAELVFKLAEAITPSLQALVIVAGFGGPSSSSHPCDARTTR